jgi:hypothetical protein
MNPPMLVGLMHWMMNPHLWEVVATSAQQRKPYIDLMLKKELVWEGQGVGYLTPKP